MAVPKSKITRSKRGMRRSHDALVASNPNECPSCGHYADREVVALADEIDLDEDAA